MFQLDLRSGRSIYEQVIDNIKMLIVHGVLKENSKLPSVRELSRELTVNPNTVQKAYKELERDGFIYTVAGKGAFVGERSGSADRETIERIRKSIGQCISELYFLGLSHDEVNELLLRTAEEKRKTDNQEVIIYDQNK